MTKMVLVVSHQIHWGKPSGGSITSFRFAAPDPSVLVQMTCLKAKEKKHLHSNLERRIYA